MNGYCSCCGRCNACGQYPPLPNNLASGAYAAAAAEGRLPTFTLYADASAAPAGTKTCDHVIIGPGGGFSVTVDVD